MIHYNAFCVYEDEPPEDVSWSLNLVITGIRMHSIFYSLLVRNSVPLLILIHCSKINMDLAGNRTPAKLIFT